MVCVCGVRCGNTSRAMMEVYAAMSAMGFSITRVSRPAPHENVTDVDMVVGGEVRCAPTPMFQMSQRFTVKGGGQLGRVEPNTRGIRVVSDVHPALVIPPFWND